MNGGKIINDEEKCCNNHSNLLFTIIANTVFASRWGTPVANGLATSRYTTDFAGGEDYGILYNSKSQENRN